jgi:hypothetical protein
VLLVIAIGAVVGAAVVTGSPAASSRSVNIGYVDTASVKYKPGAKLEINARLQAAFAVFSRHPASRSRFLQAHTAAAAETSQPKLSPRIVAEFGLVTADDEFVQDGQTRVWAVPGTDGACVVTVYPPPVPRAYELQTTVCERTEDILAHGLVGGVSLHEPRNGTGAYSGVVASLVPNGNASAELRIPADGIAQQVPVVSNIAVATIRPTDQPFGSVVVSYGDGDGGTTDSTTNFTSATTGTSEGATSAASSGQGG